jgi:predicted DNA-binding transcriptional regulator AlpA
LSDQQKEKDKIAGLRSSLSANETFVLTIPEWAALNSLSLGSAKRLLKEGRGPRTIQLSSKRIGIRVSDNARWQEERIRP